MKKVSFVIPAYNASDTIFRCLDSIYALSLAKEEFEVIVIDDGSTDDTNKIITEYVANRSNMIVKRHSINRKPGACANLGVETATGKYMQFVGADDEIISKTETDDQPFVEALEHALKHDADMQANAFIIEEFCEGMFEVNKQYGSGALYLLKRDFIMKVHRRAEEDRYYEDTDWIEYYLPRAQRITFFNKPVYHTFFNTKSITQSKKDIRNITDYILAHIRRLENTLGCSFQRYNAKIEKNCVYVIKNFLRVRNVTKFPFKDLKYLYDAVTKDNRRNMRKFDFGCQANWFFRYNCMWIMAMFFLCRPALFGRRIAAKLRG